MEGNEKQKPITEMIDEFPTSANQSIENPRPASGAVINRASQEIGGFESIRRVRRHGWRIGLSIKRGRRDTLAPPGV